jgi:hypothetical protein
MQKAHLYEAILLVNRGVEAVVLRRKSDTLRGTSRDAERLFLQQHRE